MGLDLLNDISFKHKEKDISRDDIKHALRMMESSGGTNTKDRYEPKYHKELIRKKAITDVNDKDKWFPTRAERRVIAERGEEQALKDFSTSKGEFQILPETAYRYTSFIGNPEDLKDPKVAEKVTDELLEKFHKEEGGDLEKSIFRWNQRDDYFPKFKKYLKERGADISMLNPFHISEAQAGEVKGALSFLENDLGLTPNIDEDGFQEWYANIAKESNLNPDPDDPR